MQASEMRAKSDDELDTMLGELYREQFNLRMQQGTGQLSRPDQVKNVRRDIARVKTIIGEKTRTLK